MSELQQADSLAAPYPLQDRFRRLVLPGLALVVVVIAVTMGLGGRFLVETVYLEQAARRADVIARAMVDARPEDWARLGASGTPPDFLNRPEGLALKRELDREVDELELSSLKIYSPEGAILYSAAIEEIGTPDISDAFLRARRDGRPSVVAKPQPDGTGLYELYIPGARLDESGARGLVFELYEPASYLDTVLGRFLVPGVGIPTAALIVIALLLATLVSRAQASITAQSAVIARYQDRLRGLVSGEAERAVRGSLQDRAGDLASRREACTILFLDVRGFTSFAEGNDPDSVIAMLNRIFDAAIPALRAHGADIDKLIGDAVLARFTGPGRQARAARAARAALRAVAQADVPRGIGIGVASGEVVLGAMGSADRRDFTMIGDAVNAAARLCALAGPGEIVIDDATLVEAGAGVADDFGPLERHHVKGRRAEIALRRLRDPSARQD